MDEQYEKELQKRLIIAKETGNREDEAKAYENLGSCYKKSNQLEKAIEFYHESLKIKTLTGVSDRERRVNFHLGFCYYHLGQIEKAIQHRRHCLTISKTVGNKLHEGRYYLSLGCCYQVVGQYNVAIDYYEKSLNVATQLGNRELEFKAYGNLGGVYIRLGRTDEATKVLEKQLEISKDMKDKNLEGTSYGMLGLCYYILGQYNKALQYNEKALLIAKQTGDIKDEDQCMWYVNVGNCYLRLGQIQKAKKYFEKGLEIIEQTGKMLFFGICYLNLGSCYFKMSLHDEAIEYYQKSLRFAKQVGDKTSESKCYGNLGKCYSLLGQLDKAMEHHQMLLELAEQTGEIDGVGEAYTNIGNCYNSSGQYTDAIKYFEKSLGIAKQIGDKFDKGGGYNRIGSLYYGLGNFVEAEKHHSQAIECFEELFRDSPKKDEYNVSFRDQLSYAYKDLSLTLIALDRFEDSLVTAEKGRSRSLNELMFSCYSITDSVESKGLELSTISQIRDVVATMGCTVIFLSLGEKMTYFWVLKPNGKIDFRKKRHDLKISDIWCVISEARARNALTSKVQCEDRSLSYLDIDLVDSKEETNLCSSWERANEAFIETLYSTEKDGKLKRDCHFEPVQRNIEEDDNRQQDENYLKRFYNIFFGPIRELIEGSQIAIVPDGQLNLVPYATLVDEEGRYVADSFQVRLVPSLMLAKITRDYWKRGQTKREPLIVGDPDTPKSPRLEFARIEALQIAEILGVSALIGEQATKQKVLQHITDANVIHIAAHGDAQRGEISLAPSPATEDAIKDEYMLLMSDVADKRLSANLVVLSCCHSARGAISSEGVIGIARAFLGAGARSVVVALWAIDDQSTMVFMKQFYKHLKCGKKTNESLHLAMRYMREKKFEPEQWAPFVLIGDDVAIDDVNI